MPEAPRSKNDFYERYLKGEFGNRPRLWSDWRHLAESDYRGLVSARDMKSGGPCHYGVEASDIREHYRYMLELEDCEDPLYLRLPRKHLPFDPRRFRYNEAMPDRFLTIQGNVWMGEGGLRLEYSCVPNIGHRQAVCQPNLKAAEGLLAYSLLRNGLNPTSFEDLMELLDAYPRAIVEFSAYSRKVGVIPYRNCVFWEVRDY